MSMHPKLDYSEYVPFLQRRRVQRGLVLLTIEAVTLYIIFQIGVCVYVRYPAWRSWRACLDYTPSSRDQVVYELNEDRFLKLMATNSGYFEKSHGYFVPPAAVFSPECWNQFTPSSKLPSIYGPRPVLFLHGRTTPHGVRRLLSVYIDDTGEPFVWNAIASKSSWGFEGTGLTSSTGSIRWNKVIPTDERPIDRFYAGVPDPADASHFTIEYETREGKRIIDGWLLDNTAPAPNDVTLMLKVRKGPPVFSQELEATR
jgi:hypothetical protein